MPIIWASLLPGFYEKDKWQGAHMHVYVDDPTLKMLQSWRNIYPSFLFWKEEKGY